VLAAKTERTQAQQSKRCKATLSKHASKPGHSVVSWQNLGWNRRLAIWFQIANNANETKKLSKSTKLIVRVFPLIAYTLIGVLPLFPPHYHSLFERRSQVQARKKKPASLPKK
jgi:hypothetical protein